MVKKDRSQVPWHLGERGKIVRGRNGKGKKGGGRSLMYFQLVNKEGVRAGLPSGKSEGKGCKGRKRVAFGIYETNIGKRN